MTALTKYQADELAWGNENPWRGRPRLSHKVTFTWADVRTDGKGNALDRPELLDKDCFGRALAFFRHGGRVREIKDRQGRTLKTSNYQCGRCPEGVWRACAELSFERISSDPEVLRLFNEWRAESIALHGRLVYTGPVGRLWVAFKKAYVALGPFFDVNDEFVASERDRAAQREAEAVEKEQERWRESKRRQRQADRARRAREHEPPSEQFRCNLETERDNRCRALLNVAGNCSLPKTISKIRPQDAPRTAQITADAWFYDELRGAMGYERSPGAIARMMVDDGRASGLSYATLKARLQKDLERGAILENLGIWHRFDPDFDLKAKRCDIDELDGSESIEDVLRAMEQARAYPLP